MLDPTRSADLTPADPTAELRRGPRALARAPLAVPAVNGRWDVSDDGLACILSRKIIRIQAPRAWLEQVRQLCDGRRRWADVEREMTRLGSDTALLNQLAGAGVLVEAGALLGQQARAGWVPQPLKAPLSTTEDLAAHREALDRRLTRRTAQARLRPQRTALSELLTRRGSVRTFGAPTLALSSLVNILWALYGLVGESNAGYRRTVPSGGALYGIAWYVALLADTGDYPAAFYAVHYHAGGGAQGELSLVRRKPPASEAWRTLLTPAVLSHAQAIVYPVVDMTAIEAKYGNRALTLAMLEAGHALQNAALAATLEGAASIVRGDTVETEIQAMLRLPESHYPLPALVLGRQPGKEDIERARESETRVPLRNVPGTSRSLQLASHQCVAGPLVLGRDPHFRVWAAGRATDPRLAAIKAEAESWERIGWATPRIDAVARRCDVPHAVPPEQLIAYTREQLQRPDFPFDAWSERRAYPWTAGVDAATGHAVHLMSQCVFALSSLDAVYARAPYTNATTSGIAAWTDAGGAIERALIELIERDAFARAWLLRLRPPRVPEAALPAQLRARLRDLQQAGYRTSVHRLPSPHLPVACVFAQNEARCITSVTTGAGHAFSGAAEAALREAESRVQDYHARPAPTPIKAPQVARETDHATYYRTRAGFRRADFLAASPQTLTVAELRALEPPRRGGAAPLSRLHAQGLPVYACDLTPAGASLQQGRTPLQVWRAFVPGLLPLWFGADTAPLGLIDSGVVALHASPEQRRRLQRASAIHPCT